MNRTSVQLTVFFEPPFWVGVFERQEGETLAVARIVFGAEPRDEEVLAWVNAHFAALDFSAPLAHHARKSADNPKRRQRAAARTLKTQGVGTKAQQLLQAQHEQGKEARRALARQSKASMDALRYARKQKKKKEKHRGH